MSAHPLSHSPAQPNRARSRDSRCAAYGEYATSWSPCAWAALEQALRPRSPTTPTSRASSPSSMARSSAAPRSTPPAPPPTASLASAAAVARSSVGCGGSVGPRPRRRARARRRVRAARASGRRDGARPAHLAEHARRDAALRANGLRPRSRTRLSTAGRRAGRGIPAAPGRPCTAPGVLIDVRSSVARPNDARAPPRARRRRGPALACRRAAGQRAARRRRGRRAPTSGSRSSRRSSPAGSRAFDPATGRGTLQWDRYTLGPGHSFEKTDVVYSRAQATEFPGTEYDRDPALPFEISFVSPRTLRLRLSTRDLPAAMMQGEPSIMLAGPVPDRPLVARRRTATAP